jgi:hypothetical protein
MFGFGIKRGMARLFVAGAVILGAAQASAGPITVSISGAGEYDQYYVEQEGEENADGTFTLSGLGYGETFTCDWSVTVNLDPWVTGTFNMTNISGSTQNYVLNVSLPVAAGVPLPNLMGGYIGDATNGTQYFDQNLSGAVTFASVGSTPIYQARVGATVASATTVMGLLLGDFTADGGPGAFGDISQQAWGTPIPSQPGTLGVPAGGVINVRATFSLTAGDRVSLPVHFRVDPVPEPGTLVLVGLGLAAVAGLRARRS